MLRTMPTRAVRLREWGTRLLELGPGLMGLAEFEADGTFVRAGAFGFAFAVGHGDGSGPEGAFGGGEWQREGAAFGSGLEGGFEDGHDVVLHRELAVLRSRGYDDGS